MAINIVHALNIKAFVGIAHNLSKIKNCYKSMA